MRNEFYDNRSSRIRFIVRPQAHGRDGNKTLYITFRP
jgi:hypothetical protein